MPLQPRKLFYAVLGRGHDEIEGPFVGVEFGNLFEGLGGGVHESAGEAVGHRKPLGRLGAGRLGGGGHVRGQRPIDAFQSRVLRPASTDQVRVGDVLADARANLPEGRKRDPAVRRVFLDCPELGKA